MSVHIHSWLALGDSYTCGEGVSPLDTYAYQTVQLLRKAKQKWHAPEIVAKTGWTSFELGDYVIHHQFQDHYDFVTLLIGVNNQYRGLNADDFSVELDFLIKKAIHFAGGKKNNVLLLSIPDWELTPFAKKNDASKPEKHVDKYNEECLKAAADNGVIFLDLRQYSNQQPMPLDLLAGDQLHYSGKMYALWSNAIAEHVLSSHF